MQSATSFFRVAGSQASKKSECIVDAVPEESDTVPVVVGTSYLRVKLSWGIGVGWVDGHTLVVPSLPSLEWVKCDL